MDVSKIFARNADAPETVPTEETKNAPLPMIKNHEPKTVDWQKPPLGMTLTADHASITSPVKPLRHPLSERFHQLLKEIGDLHDKKQQDYGTPDDPFANVRGATDFGFPAPTGAFIAMSDIMVRIKSFVKNGRLENEPLDNALKDMAVYSLIALVLYEEERDSK